MIGRSLIILAVTTLGATAVVAHSSKVTVHRGSDTHTTEIDSQGYAVAPKVRIERVPQGPAETAAQANTRIHVTGVSGLAVQPVAGQTLWLTDESDSGFIACRLVWAELNPRWSDNPPWVISGKRGLVIRCYTEDGDVERPGNTFSSAEYSPLGAINASGSRKIHHSFAHGRSRASVTP